MFTRQLPQKKKSCSHCVKAKRKCDLTLPKCRRCTKQKLRCEYPFAEVPTERSSKVAEETPKIADVWELSSAFDPTLPQYCDHSATLDVFLTGDTLQAMPHIAPQDPVPVNMELITPSLLDVASLRRPVAPFSVSSLNSVSSSRLLYAVDLIKKAPATMVQENQTPWSHPRLYEDAMPQFLSEAYAACALSLSRTKANYEFVSRHIENRFDELLVAPIPNTLQSLLAQIHAFVLYLSLQVFSGDYRAQCQVHRALPQLESYGYQLHTRLTLDNGLNLDSLPALLPLYPIAQADQEWRLYILHESARRTLLLVFFMMSLCLAMRGEMLYCHSRGALYSYLLGSSHLWTAGSAFDFAKAWNEKNRLVVDNMNFTLMLKVGRPGDVDSFGKMLLVATLGIDEVRGWFAVNGGSF